MTCFADLVVDAQPGAAGGQGGGELMAITDLVPGKIDSADQGAGVFRSEIVPVEIPGKKGPTVFEKDEAWITCPVPSNESIVSSGSPAKGSSR